GDRAGEVVPGRRRERRVLHQIPHLGHERVRVHVDDGHAAAADHRAAPCIGGDLGEAVAADGETRGCACNGLDEITSIRHCSLLYPPDPPSPPFPPLPPSPPLKSKRLPPPSPRPPRNFPPSLPTPPPGRSGRVRLRD